MRCESLCEEPTGRAHLCGWEQVPVVKSWAKVCIKVGSLLTLWTTVVFSRTTLCSQSLATQSVSQSLSHSVTQKNYLNLPTDIECVIRIYLHRTTPSLLGVHLLRWWRLCAPQVRVEVDCLAVMTVTSSNRNYVIRTASQFLFLKMIISLGRLKNDAWSLCAPCPPHAQSATSDLGNR